MHAPRSIQSVILATGEATEVATLCPLYRARFVAGEDQPTVVYNHGCQDYVKALL
jgi:hypothetical protein